MTLKTALTAHIAIDQGLNAQQVLAAAIAKIRDRYVIKYSTEYFFAKYKIQRNFVKFRRIDFDIQGFLFRREINLKNKNIALNPHLSTKKEFWLIFQSTLIFFHFVYSAVLWMLLTSNSDDFIFFNFTRVQF